ncbi:PTS sugar transporter subunit IIA [Sporosalibacterium faouarense]|uniref:PTS sugar transporter subunit IIA n=1 Tax=Sporosalibacterium faouarense TaxID=516123 RepID=UPI00141D3309|nr:PTS sugar transporter subunit IIA [Bacillota bacterium]
MLKKYFSSNSIKLSVNAKTPEEAIREAGNILVKEGKIKGNYVEDMIKTYKELGPYIVLAPGIAMPHSKPSEDVKETAISFIQLKEPIEFGHPTNDPVKLVFALGGVDHSSHIGMLQQLSMVLSNSEKLNKLMNIKSYEEFLKIID